MAVQKTAIRFPSDRDFAEFRDWIDRNYRANEATVRRNQVLLVGTTAILTTSDFPKGDHEALAAVAFQRHAGVIL